MALEVWTDPATPNGAIYFFSVPEVMAEDEALTGSVSISRSLGTSSNPTAYVASSAWTWTGDEVTVLPESVMSGYPNIENLYYYVTSSGVTVSGQAAFTTERPSHSAWGIKDNTGATVTGSAIPKTGKIYLSGLKGYTDTSTTFTIPLIQVYMDGVLIIELTEKTPALGTSNTCSSLFSCEYIQRHEYYKTYTGPFNGPGNYLDLFTVDVQATNGAIEIPYKLVDIPDHCESMYIIVTNSAGLTNKTGNRDSQKERFFPIIDRVSVAESEMGSVRIIGSLQTDSYLQGIEYTVDRRVPVLHLRFRSSDVSWDNDGPVASGGTLTWVSGKFANTSARAFGASAYLDYSNQWFNPWSGTVELWYNPTSTLGATKHHIFSIYKTSPVGQLKETITLRVSSGGLEGSVLASTSAEYTVTASGGFTAGTWYHLTFKWETNKAGASRLYVKRYPTGGTATEGVVTGASLPFPVAPTKNLSSLLSNEPVSTTGYYSTFRVGADHFNNSASGAIADFRLSDCWTIEDHSTDTEMSGWKSTGAIASASVNPNDNMFTIFGTDTIASGAIYVMKIRGYTTSSNRPESSMFNTPAGKPILLRGTWTGVDASVGTKVERFRFIDVEGMFEDYTLSVNPTSYSIVPSDDVMVKQVSSINGDRVLSTSKLPSESNTMSWENCSRQQMLELEKRAVAGNTFFMIDHNDKVYYGKMNLENIEEILASVPSRYKVSVKFVGQGGRDDYRMG